LQSQFFDTPIEFVKGVGPQRAAVFKSELGIYTANDLLHHFPFRYIDRSKFYKINELNDEMPFVQIKGKITSLKSIGDKRAMRLSAQFADETGTMDLVWFKGITWIRDSIKAGVEYVVFGKPALFGKSFNIVHPEIELLEKFLQQPQGEWQAVYNTTEKCKLKGIDSKAILKIQKTLIAQIPNVVQETLTPTLLHQFNLLPAREALINIHVPANTEALQKAQFRFKFEELFFLQLKILSQKAYRNENFKGKIFEKIGNHFNSFYKENLPFDLTNAQKQVIKEIRLDCGSGKQMNRLLQGDVGSGKTVVALLSMLMALDNGFQSCMMAPTEILAQQHFASVSNLLKNLPVNVKLLTGSTKTKARKEILMQLEDGSLDILIGTHALIVNDVKFKNLGIVVIDEQHRFGVEQRAKLWMQGKTFAHVLVMTATPIPRTLAMTLYGDLDVSIIDELPPGRKSIKTIHLKESSRLRLFGFMREEIKKGRQIYVVYPLIEESEKLDFANLMEGYDAIVREFPLPDFRISILHGRLKPQAKEYEMSQFLKGITQIMVATTVIEVGVNIPNASVMIIESAQKFGLSQLHQLRGRVGRGAEQSFCILMTADQINFTAKQRIATMVKTNDGFEISETDLKLRGPGEIAGTQQSGVLALKIADLAKDQAILELARSAAQNILTVDPTLTMIGNAILKKGLNRDSKQQTDWKKVS
jgi:ATP-dependent DNA helicase RecG